MPGLHSEECDHVTCNLVGTRLRARVSCLRGLSPSLLQEGPEAIRSNFAPRDIFGLVRRLIGLFSKVVIIVFHSSPLRQVSMRLLIETIPHDSGACLCHKLSRSDIQGYFKAIHKHEVFVKSLGFYMSRCTGSQI